MSDSDAPVQMGLIDGPGSILCRAREAKKLDIATVASMLHLSESKIKALESDDFDSLPEPVFVRGYLQNYARILDEPVAPILDAYRNFGFKSDLPEQKLADPEVEVEVGNSPDLVKIITIVIAAALILIPLAWWWSDLGQAVQGLVSTKESPKSEQLEITMQPDDKEEDTSSESIQFPKLPELEETTDPVVEEKSEERVKTTIEVKPEQPDVDSVIKELELPSSAIKPIDLPQQPAVAEIKPEPEPINEPEQKPKPKPKVEPKPKAVKAKPVSTPASKSIAIPAPKSVPSQQGVWFIFVESGWVKVRDAKNRVILIGEHNKGAIKKLGSAMPYKVVLGNSKAVKVEINGKVVDVEKYSSGGVARFTIDNGKIGKP
jgi:cytoskeleton protein RodZ